MTVASLTTITLCILPTLCGGHPVAPVPLDEGADLLDDVLDAHPAELAGRVLATQLEDVGLGVGFVLMGSCCGPPIGPIADAGAVRLLLSRSLITNRKCAKKFCFCFLF